MIIKQNIQELVTKLKQENSPLESNNSQSNSSQINISSVDLNLKINNFINWYYKNMVEGYHNEFSKYYPPIEMRNFIEKVAVWYELKYPDYEINRLIPYTACEQPKKNETTEIKNWSKLLNTNYFIKSLPKQERSLFTKSLHSNYRKIVYLGTSIDFSYVCINKNGIVKMAKNIDVYTKNIINDKELKGLHLKKVIKLFEEKDIYLPENGELKEAARIEDKKAYQKSEMLNCIMYRIIERGGNRIGPRRAFLFAKEFKRNIDIPMMYGIDYFDPGLRLFINKYLKSGGSKNLTCYIGYFQRKTKKDTINTISIQEILFNTLKYTPEEIKLHQRLIAILVSQTKQAEAKNPQKVKSQRKFR